jgi:hypothetical protein
VLAVPVALGCRHETPPAAEAPPTVVVGAPPPEAPAPAPTARPTEAPSAEAPPVEAMPAIPEYDVMFNIDDADVTSLMTAVTNVVHQPVAVDPDARAMAACAQASIHSPDKVKASAVPGLVDKALAKKGLSLRPRNGILTLSRLPGARPPWEIAGRPEPACARGAPTSFPYTPPPDSPP